MRDEMVTACIKGKLDAIEGFICEIHSGDLKNKDRLTLIARAERYFKHLKDILSSQSSLSLGEILNILNVQNDLSKCFEEGSRGQPISFEADKPWLEAWYASRDIRCILHTYFLEQGWGFRGSFVLPELAKA